MNGKDKRINSSTQIFREYDSICLRASALERIVEKVNRHAAAAAARHENPEPMYLSIEDMAQLRQELAEMPGDPQRAIRLFGVAVLEAPPSTE